MSKVEELISIIQTKLKYLVSKISNYNVTETEVSSRIAGAANELKTNPFLIGDIDFRSEIDSYLKEIEDEDYLISIIEDITVLDIVCDAKKRGIDVSLNSDEIDKVNRVCEALLKVEETLKQRNEQLRKQKSADEILSSKYSCLYDKLIAGENSLEHFTDSEIDMILELIKDKDFAFKFEILEYIRNISNVINQNIVNGKDEIDAYDDENSVEIDEDIIRNLFIKYHYEYDGMPDKFKKLLRNKCKVQKLIDLFEYMEGKEEFKFLKDCGKTPSSSANRAGFKKLVLLLRYATVETLDYIVRDAEKRGITIDEIFKVEGVYKHVSKPGRSVGSGGDGETDELSISGSFEYYKGNALMLDELSREYQMKFGDPSIDFYKTTLETYPELFERSPEVIKNNIDVARKYQLQLVEKDVNTYHIKCPSFLTTGHLMNKIDLLLENAPLYDYILKYPSLLKEDLNIDIAISLRLLGRLEFNSIGQVKDVRRIRRPLPTNMSYLDEFRDNVPRIFVEAASEHENVSVYRNDDVTLELENKVDREKHNGLTYNLNGVYVSKNKFSRVWTAIMKKYDELSDNDKENYDIKQLLVYSLTYNSCYTVLEFDAIKSYVEEMNYGGKSL